MSEKSDQSRSVELLEMLQRIGVDLWQRAPLQGSAPQAADTVKTETASEKNQAEAKAAGENPAAGRTPAPREKCPVSLAELFRVADEAVDWTDALVYEQAPDGLTSPERWALYRRFASGVLRGDPAAYAQVLKELNPLGDLLPLAEDMNIRVPDADHLQVFLKCRASMLKQDPELYPAALSIRIARDLFAALPVAEVSVHLDRAEREPGVLCFSRKELRDLPFQFLDPVALMNNAAEAGEKNG